MRRIRTVLLALAALAAAPAARAQAPAGETATEAAAAASAGAPVSAPAPAVDAPSASASGLPRYTPPRTLRAYTHVFVAFAIAWALLLGYMFVLARKFRRVEEQVEALARS